MLLGIRRRDITDWCGQSSRIVVVDLEEFRNVMDGIISSVYNMCVGFSNVDEIIGISVLDILPYFLQSEVHYFGFI